MPDTAMQMVPSTPVVETASATTSPDNASSGYAAYLIAAAGLAVAMLLAWSLASTVLGIVGLALSDYGDYGGPGDINYDLEDLDETDRQQLIEDLIQQELDQQDDGDGVFLPDSFDA